MNEWINNAHCVDTSFVIKLITRETDSTAALQLYENWLKGSDFQLIAPTLLDYEIGSVLRRKLKEKAISGEDLLTALDFYNSLDIKLLHQTNFISNAIGSANLLNQTNLYDVAYLLLAKQQQCKLFTCDKHFFNSAHAHFDFVELVGK